MEYATPTLEMKKLFFSISTGREELKSPKKQIVYWDTWKYCCFTLLGVKDLDAYILLGHFGRVSTEHPTTKAP